MEAGLRRPLLPPRKAQPEGAVQGERRAARCMQGRGSAPWKRACGGRSCFPARHSPKGQCGHGRGSAEKRKRDCGGRSCFPARRSPKGTQGERRAAGMHGRKGAPWKRDRGRPHLPPCKAQPEGDAGGEVRGAGMQGRGSAPWKRACGRPLLPPRKAQSEGGRREERVRGTACMGGRRAMEAGLRRPLLLPRRHSPKGQCMGERVRGAGMQGRGSAEKRTRAILSGVWYHFIEKVLDLM